MTKRSLTAALCVLLLVGACATGADVYGPASSANDRGYQDQLIEEDRVRITYRARDRGTAEDGALRRAAEIALREGFDGFFVLSRDVESDQRDRSRGSVSVAGGSGGRTRVGVGVSIGLGDSYNDSATVRLEVLLKDEPPANSDPARWYEAQEVLDNLTANGAF